MSREGMCARCGRTFVPRASGRRQIYCSKRCRKAILNQRWYWRHHERGKARSRRTANAWYARNRLEIIARKRAWWESLTRSERVAIYHRADHVQQRARTEAWKKANPDAWRVIRSRSSQKYNLKAALASISDPTWRDIREAMYLWRGWLWKHHLRTQPPSASS